MKSLFKLVFICLFISSTPLFAMEPTQKPGCCEPTGCCCRCWTGFCLCCSKTIDIAAVYGPSIAALAATVVATIPGIQNKEVAAQWINAIQTIGTSPQAQALLKALSTACSETATELSAEDARILTANGVPIKKGQVDPKFKLLFQNMVEQAKAEASAAAQTRTAPGEERLVVLPFHAVASNLYRRFVPTL